MFSIFGCPMHFGVGAPGLKYSLDYLRNRYENLRIVKLPEIIMEEDPDCVLKNRNTVAATCQSIAQYMYSVFETGKTPLFLGGDHSVVCLLYTSFALLFQYVISNFPYLSDCHNESLSLLLKCLNRIKVKLDPDVLKSFINLNILFHLILCLCQHAVILMLQIKHLSLIHI